MPARRLDGKRFVGNTNSNQVHDLNNEQTNCQINEIIRSGHSKPFGKLDEALAEGYSECGYCSGS